MKYFLTACLILTATTAQAKHQHKESVYRDAWCKGETEVRLPNGNRADCVTKNYAIEVEFAPKYHEAIGQALDYADQTGKKPAILLIIERDKDWRYYNKLKPLARENHIKVWYMRPARLPVTF
jgi:hypothetical protein